MIMLTKWNEYAIKLFLSLESTLNSGHLFIGTTSREIIATITIIGFLYQLFLIRLSVIRAVGLYSSPFVHRSQNTAPTQSDRLNTVCCDLPPSFRLLRQHDVPPRGSRIHRSGRRPHWDRSRRRVRIWPAVQGQAASSASDGQRSGQRYPTSDGSNVIYLFIYLFLGRVPLQTALQSEGSGCHGKRWTAW